ncbi:MAG: hypothetical protein R6U19_01000 [Bacteroidales bacterium]
MLHKSLKPRKALNKAFLKVKPNRSDIEKFKSNLRTLLEQTNDTESEEFHKNLVSDFLKKTYYETGDINIPVEKEIDRLVYELYGLTEEIKIVEGTT